MRGSKAVLVCLILLLMLGFLPDVGEAQGEERIRAAFFYSPDCPCSNRSIKILNDLKVNYSDFEVTYFNLFYDDNFTRLDDFYEAYNVIQEERYDYPFIFIGDFYYPSRKVSYATMSQIIESYEGQDVQLWPDWGEVRWTTCMILFYNSTTPEGLNALGAVQSFNTSHLRLAAYDTSESPYNTSQLALFLEAYGSSQFTGTTAVFIGNDVLLANDITQPNIDNILLKYSGGNTPCRDVTEPQDSGNICVTVFYSSTCGECFSAKRFLSEMDAKYPELNVRYYNILEDDNEVLKQSYGEYYDVPVEKRGTLMVFIGDEYFTSVDDLEDGFEDQVKRYEGGISCPSVEPDESVVVDTFRSFSVLAIMAAGLIDGLNPCAFATLIFFISYLSTTKRNEKQILFIGISFVMGVFVAYLLLGIGILRGLETASETAVVSMVLYPLAGVIAFIFGSYSVYDYGKIRRGQTREMVLKLPKRIKELVRWIIERQANMKYFTIFAFFTGMIISLFEFVCTGQVYLPTIIYIMGVPDYRMQAFGYLVLYNVMFVLPLILIFVAAYFGVSHRRLRKFLKKRIGLIKILTAVMFFVLAIFMVILTMGYMA